MDFFNVFVAIEGPQKLFPNLSPRIFAYDQKGNNQTYIPEGVLIPKGATFPKGY